MKLFAFKLGAEYQTFTREIEAKIDLVSGKYMIPAFATNIELIEQKEGFQRYFKEGDWHYIEDNIGTEYFDSNGNQTKINRLGEVPPTDALFERPIITPSNEELESSARASRNTLINKVSIEIERLTDNKKETENWRTYRQFLRDIPSQKGFPQSIDWGIAPAEYSGN
ncbi:hypothetical protein MED121_02245 [Marinomonas sp. MED121]|uniref:phage tail assembly chaperone n=1 Tax=Marinomonas sp. MED121 TaxID=314277 RepID=UPI0000690AB6|nr:phage tail assembly chaperone [Marinomonas sp. MED121]EAQ65994.1 hypothetical protein MED121_02245 [Marinomonas sp. MED121]